MRTTRRQRQTMNTLNTMTSDADHRIWVATMERRALDIQKLESDFEVAWLVVRVLAKAGKIETASKARDEAREISRQLQQLAA